jgi:hypothetical protein
MAVEACERHVIGLVAKNSRRPKVSAAVVHWGFVEIRIGRLWASSFQLCSSMIEPRFLLGSRRSRCIVDSVNYY